MLKDLNLKTAKSAPLCLRAAKKLNVIQYAFARAEKAIPPQAQRGRAMLQMLMSAYAPDSINQALGIYIPLIVVNCIILGRAESFAAKNSPIASLFDGIGCGLGFTLGLTILGSAREILGAGSVFGITLLPETTNILMFILPPGAFLTLGYIIAIFNKVKK